MIARNRSIILIGHNLRSCNNVGSLLRTADGIGVETVYLTGYTPYPMHNGDSRLPHIARKVHARISKTALGAEKTVNWNQQADVFMLISRLKNDGYTVGALEQTKHSANITTWTAPHKFALLVGRETEGIETDVLSACDVCLEIPMYGQKESFNVVQAAAMALYHCRFMLM